MKIAGVDLGQMEVRDVFDATANLKPTILSKEKTRYTEAALTNRVEGQVLLTAIFTAEGKVTSIKIVRGLPFGLSDQAALVASKIKFKPAMKDGVPVNVRMAMEYTFVLP